MDYILMVVHARAETLSVNLYLPRQVNDPDAMPSGSHGDLGCICGSSQTSSR